MLRLPVSRFVPALLAFLPLAALAQAPVDSVVRTTTVVTTTTTTVTKPAAPGSKPSAPVTTSSSTTTTTAEPAAGATTTPTARQPAPGDLTGARSRSSTSTTTTTAAKPAPAAPAKPAAASKPAGTASKPKTSVPAASAARTTARRPADPEVVRFLQTDVDLTLVRADQLPNLYERFMETTRAERRQWNAAQWASASAMLARLNQRYEQVRGELSLEEKLNIRTLQGEFRGLEAAKQVSKRL